MTMGPLHATGSPRGWPEIRRKRNGLSPAAAVTDPIDFRLPPTVSAEALTEGGSDARFRQMISDLFTVSVRMDAVRNALAKSLGVSGPQYSILMAIARLEGSGGVTVELVIDHHQQRLLEATARGVVVGPALEGMLEGEAALAEGGVQLLGVAVIAGAGGDQLHQGV